jgi:hypothetical protein
MKKCLEIHTFTIDNYKSDNAESLQEDLKQHKINTKQNTYNQKNFFGNYK